MDRLARRHLRLDGVEEADELLMPMPLHVAANDGAIEHVERGEQRRRAVALVVVGHGAGAALLHGQAGLGAVERLDLAFLVDRKHDGMRGRVDVEADDVLELLGEPGVVRQFERADAVRRELVGFQDALHRTQADARRLRQHATRPVRRFSRWRPERQIDDARHRVGRQRRLAGPARLVAHQTLDALRHEACLPCPDHGLRLARPAHDLGGATPIGGGEDNVRTPDMLLRRAASGDDRLKATTIFPRDVDDDPCSHRRSLNQFGRIGNRPYASDH